MFFNICKQNTSDNFILTVLCPNYNNERYLERAIESILQQKCNFNYKIIVIDDCSTDNSIKIIDSYVKKFPNKIYLYKNKKNLRLLGTIIKGYRMVNTEFFTVLDPDDYYIDEHYFQRAIDFLRRHQQYTVYVNNTIMKKDGNDYLFFHDIKTKDYILNDAGDILLGHTSSTVFRNKFNKNNLDTIEKYIGTEYEKAFRGDTFRNLFALNFGKGHFENKNAGVYNFTHEGIWSKLSFPEMRLLNLKAFIAFFMYFDKGKKFFLNKISYWLINCYKSKISFQEIDHQLNILIEYIYAHPLILKNIWKPFVFYLPSKGVGGYQFLFIRLAKYLSERGATVYYIDYNDSLSFKELKNTNIRHIRYTDGITKIKKIYKMACNVITPITLTNQLLQFTHPESKIYFWVAHPKSVIWTQERAHWSFEQTKEYFEQLNLKNALCYMDRACYQGTIEKLNINMNEYYVPIFSPQKENINYKSLVNTKELNLGWLGRLDIDKIYSLINVLDNVYQYSTSKKINFHIIGTGAAKSLINVNKYHDKINLIFTSTLINKQLNDYLINNIDILFAMGTSLLEGAALKIPSVLTLASHAKFDTDKFVLLSNLSDYNLGFYVDKISSYNYKYQNLASILDQVYKENKKADLGKKSYQYFINNHCVKNTFKYFLGFILIGSAFTKDMPIAISHNKHILPRFNFKKRYKLIFYLSGVLLAQLPFVDIFINKHIRLKLLTKIKKYWR